MYILIIEILIDKIVFIDDNKSVFVYSNLFLDFHPADWAFLEIFTAF